MVALQVANLPSQDQQEFEQHCLSSRLPRQESISAGVAVQQQQQAIEPITGAEEVRSDNNIWLVTNDTLRRGACCLHALLLSCTTACPEMAGHDEPQCSFTIGTSIPVTHSCVGLLALQKLWKDFAGSFRRRNNKVG